jgi:hypothetical protein
MTSFPSEKENDSCYSLPPQNVSSTLTREIRDEYGIVFPTPPGPMTTPETRVENLLGSTLHLRDEIVIDNKNTSVMGRQPNPALAGLQRPPQRHNVTVEDVYNSKSSDNWSESSADKHVTTNQGTATTPTLRDEVYV